MMMFVIGQKDWGKMFKDLNNQIQKQLGFFGPKWFCWLLVFLGFELWIIEGIFKALGYAENGPGYILIEEASFALNSDQYIKFGILSLLITLLVMSFAIYFPSFMFLFTKIIVFKLVERFRFTGYFKIYLIGFFIFTFPFWFNVYLYDIVKMFS